MKRQFGLVEWDSVEFKNNARQSGGKDEFIYLTEGDNEVRLLTKAYQYSLHRFKDEGEGGIGKRIKCAVSEENDECVLCDGSKELNVKPQEPKERWYVGIIDREHEMYKIMDISQLIFKQLQKYNRNDKIGSPLNFDINIVVDKEGGPAGYYTLQKYDKEPLSAHDVELKKKVDTERLLRLCNPLPPEKVVEAIKRHRADSGYQPPKVAVQQPVQAAPQPVETTATEPVADPDSYQFQPAKRPETV